MEDVFVEHLHILIMVSLIYATIGRVRNCFKLKFIALLRTSVISLGFSRDSAVIEKIKAHLHPSGMELEEGQANEDVVHHNLTHSFNVEKMNVGAESSKSLDTPVILKWLGKDFGIKILDKVQFKMDHQKSKEHLIFEDGVRKNKAAKTRLLRKNVLQVKKTRRLKTMSKENAPISSALPNKPLIYTAVNSKVNQEIEESNVTSPKVSEIQISTPPPSNQAMQVSIHNRKKWINDEENSSKVVKEFRKLIFFGRRS
ncbi:COP-1 interacting protein [Medicago truncatula]|uniref:COP-1 interacting protein n=1 Tax=Medicago truncatula TaxID=3880 RepID=G7ZUW6_MEDTR|nr:COP-1 interacting protein [Medicago truncatula]